MALVEVAEEKVLVVPTSRLHALGYFQGFTNNYRPYWEGLIQGGKFAYLPRSEAENDPSWKQLIPYVVLVHGEREKMRVFYYVRREWQGEERLHGKWSIGVGGHICSDDGLKPGTNPYHEGLKRELAEEIEIDADVVFTSLLGLLNDDTTEVGRVHLGIVHRYRLSEPRVTLKEDPDTECGFQPVSWLLERRDKFESWSQFCLDALARSAK